MILDCLDGKPHKMYFENPINQAMAESEPETPALVMNILIGKQTFYIVQLIDLCVHVRDHIVSFNCTNIPVCVKWMYEQSTVSVYNGRCW